MSMLLEYERASRDAELARLRRVMALRGLNASGLSQSEIARRIGVSQSAVSQQLSRERMEDRFAHELIEAGAPILREIAAEHGFSDLAVFGSAARGDDRIDSDVDLLVTPPIGATLTDMIQLEEALASILGRKVDLVSRRGLKAGLDDDVLQEAVML